MDAEAMLPTTFLSSLSPVERAALFDTCPRLQISSGELLMCEGEDLESLYIVAWLILQPPIISLCFSLGDTGQWHITYHP